MTENEETTTLRVKVITRNSLAELARKDDTFDDVIQRLLKKVKEGAKHE